MDAVSNADALSLVALAASDGFVGGQEVDTAGGRRRTLECRRRRGRSSVSAAAAQNAIVAVTTRQWCFDGHVEWRHNRRHVVPIPAR